MSNHDIFPTVVFLIVLFIQQGSQNQYNVSNNFSLNTTIAFHFVNDCSNIAVSV